MNLVLEILSVAASLVASIGFLVLIAFLWEKIDNWQRGEKE